MKRTFAIVASLTAVAFLLGSPASGEAVQVAVLPPLPTMPPPEIEVEEAEAAAANWGVSVTQATERLRRQPYLRLVQAVALAMFPHSYAGLWVDHNDGGAITLGFTLEQEDLDLPEATAPSLPGDCLPGTDAGSTCPIGSQEQPQTRAQRVGRYLNEAYPHLDTRHFKGVETDYSYALLQSLYLSINGQLESLWHTPPGPRIETLDLDIMANRVKITVPTSGHWAAARWRFPHPAIEIEIDPGILEEQHQHCVSRFECYDPMRAGLRTNAPGGNLCTAGFVSTNGTSDYIMTAGHCYAKGEYAYHQTKMIGVTAASTGGPTIVDLRFYDVARIHVNKPHPTVANVGWNTRNWVYQSDAVRTYQIRRVADPDDVHPGTAVCVAGATSNKLICYDAVSRWWVVGQGDGSYRIDALTFTNSATGRCEQRGGDSGSPIYAAGAAYGIHSLKYTYVEGGQVCVATHVRYAEDVLKIRVRTS